MKDLVSVIIPVYNVEKYLDRCLSSVVNQTYRNLEVILVDDGSPDGCPKMCDDWAEKDSRIKVIHKQNAGLGMARNTGIEHATGKYICFFDSDDYVDLDAIKLAVELAEEQSADVVVFGMAKVDREGLVLCKNIPVSEKKCFCQEEVLQEYLPALIQPSLENAKIRNVTISACNSLFRLDCIRTNDWRFVSERDIISEDVYSLIELFQYVRTVAVLEKALYYYCENGTSLTRTYRPDRFVRNKYFYESCIELCDRCGYPETVKKACISPFLGNTIGAMKQVVANIPNRKAARKAIKEIVDDPLIQKVLQIKKQDPVYGRTRALLWAMEQKNYIFCYWLLSIAVIKNKGNRQ